MTVMKSKDMDWKQYLRQLAESFAKISDIERVEFAGYLLRRDMQSTSNPAVLFDTIFSSNQYFIADYIADVLIAESPDSIEDLLKNTKHLITSYYEDEINSLIKGEEKIVEEERKAEHMREKPLDEDTLCL